MDPRPPLRLLALALAAAALPTAACSVFDPALYHEAAPDMLDLPDGGGAPDLGSNVPTLALADRCVADVPTLATSPLEFVVDTTGLGDDLSDLSACTGHEAHGNDGFFAISTLAGQRWHFHVHPLTPGTDLSLYVLPTCDERSCTVRAAEDECAAGRDEHLSFIAPNAGRFIVGIDARAAGGGKFDVLAVRPVCGDGATEHSESCDDGNLNAGDGCDGKCRAELSAARLTEVEPNDDVTGANVVMLGGATTSLTVHGRLGGRCDFDTYAIEVPMGGTVRATLLDASSAPCAANVPAMGLSFLTPDGYTVAGSVSGSDGAGCPAIGAAQTWAANLQTPGTYYVRVATIKDEAAAFDYSLKLELN
jgi:cysteine-rich repeat protein